MKLRVGQGLDVHRWIAGRPLMLGGINIPHDQGLLGHSDADVLLHAIIDALLGGAGLGDIGRLFPDTDAAYAGIDSKILLSSVAEKVKSHNWRILNIDATVICQRPRLAPYMPLMAQTIANILNMEVTEVNIKATTTEKLGFTGRNEGVAAQAVALLIGMNA
ncbi:MAG: 2-C-methyl-D-erythritol 2,4-cyclodiphosphate synthase [Magnetococcales bacterium]|nr:2-C-methyl-D-erythritol 2,4-cyclodiphosphate synthase [Magnetococcales bacterium]MBF0150921.1 2-C-methyl-D-erythritol 2,4-cyclodiphosphate synthase [Magnetococcales bacterium]